MANQSAVSEPVQHPASAKTAADLWPEDSLHYRNTLRALIDETAELAHQVIARAKSQPQPATTGAAPAPDISLPLERITRVIRYGIALARKVAEPLPDVPTKSAHERTKIRDHIIREVEDVILDHFNGRAFKNFRDDLFCSLEKPDFEKALENRPIPELITRLVQELGLAGISGPEPLKYHTDDALEEIEERANRPRPPRGPAPWPEPSPKKPVQASRSFLEKRTKKLE